MTAPHSVLGRLLEALRALAGGNGGLPLPVDMLSELLGIDRRTAYRMITAIKAAGIPLRRVGLPGGRVSYSIRPREFLAWLSSTDESPGRATIQGDAARRGKARQGTARLGMARPGKARQGKGSCS